MSASNRTRTNIASILLHNDENEYLFGCLGKGCVTLATGVVQLYLSDAPDAHKWNKRCCGVATFIKDNNKRSYYIRVYDIKKKIMLWEQELYNQFRYKAPREYFHTFECDKNQAGLNFASEDEARLFKVSVETKLRERSQRKLEKKNKSVRSSPTAAKPPSLTAPINSQSKIATNVDNKLNGSGTLKNKKSKEKKKPRITKDDIGTPTDFKHVSHVGWDPNNGFDMSNLEPDMQNLFQSVGISSDVDEATVEFIYDFVEKHGGIDAVKKEISQRPTPPPPPTAASASRGGPPPPPSRSPTSSAPPPPARTQQAPPPPPSRIAGGRPTVQKNAGRPSAAAPPPPPAVHSSRPPPPPAAGVPPPPSPAAGFPPPPPPPPTVGATPPAPPPPPGPAVMSPPGAVTNGRPNLMDAIRAGKKLSAAPVETSSHDSDGDSRDTLMKAIQSGSKLKPVEQSQSRAQSMNEQDGLVGALARALANRQKAVRGSDDDSDDDDESDEIDDDEWDDN